jgi:nucleoside-diphosphate-sugar epimerase
LLQEGHEVAVFNRGQTRDDLPEEVERLRGDRTDPAQLKNVLGGREFDLVVDTTLYTGAEAEAAVELFAGRVGRYIFLSTGQVYLVRVGLLRPFKEEDYDGPVMPEPLKSDEGNHSNWLYGFGKREAEDVFARAWTRQQFPFTSLRLPMVNSERDHFDRIYGYFLRLKDGGPILVPEGTDLPVRHVYGDDVVQAITRLTASELGKGRAYNIAQDDTLTLEQFLELLAEAVHRTLKIIRVSREKLEQEGLLPECSPFSDQWMSSIENVRSKAELRMQYTPMSSYVKKLVNYYQAIPTKKIEGYVQREKELKLVQER